MLCQAGRRCSVGVVGSGRSLTAVGLIVLCGVSGRSLERVAVVGESPVRENATAGLGLVPE